MTWLVVAAILGICALTGIWLVAVRKRRRRTATDIDAQKAAARRAIASLSKVKRRNKKGTIRGEGGGGDSKTEQDAAYGTDFGGHI